MQSVDPSHDPQMYPTIVMKHLHCQPLPMIVPIPKNTGRTIQIENVFLFNFRCIFHSSFINFVYLHLCKFDIDRLPTRLVHVYLIIVIN